MYYVPAASAHLAPICDLENMTDVYSKSPATQCLLATEGKLRKMVAINQNQLVTNSDS